MLSKLMQNNSIVIRSLKNYLFSVLAAVCLLTIPIPYLTAQSVADDTCMMCHKNKGGRVPFIDKAILANSAHGRLQCVSCHRDAGSIPHPDKLAPVVCARCHSAQSNKYLGSRHGRAAKGERSDAEACSDCHGSGHAIFSNGNEDSPVFRSNIVDTCARCHADAKRMVGVRLSVSDPVHSYKESIHGIAFLEGNTDAAVCTDCHGSHSLLNALNPESSIYKKNIPETCGSCHSEVAETYAQSVHGRTALSGAQESPVCTDCHGSHPLFDRGEPGRMTSMEAVTQICADCHESEQIVQKFDLPLNRLRSYRESYHGMAAQRGDTNVANCASCHGYHDILPSNDPNSSINRANLAKTCGTCHPGAGERLASANIHGAPASKHWSLAAVQWFYWTLIPFALIVMLVHNGMDWLRKLWTGLRTPLHAGSERLTANERIQHFILILTFVLLALSGFALKFPDALWAQYLAPSEETLRRSLHRWAALVFSLLSVYHLIYMVVSKRGRYLLRELMPRMADLKDMIAVAAYNTGIRRSRPEHTAYYRYPEKIEYWALIWGAIVMMISGGLLVFNNFTLSHFPLWVSDLATYVHYYEAILACLAIVVWHFYGVIFDPDVYPMNCAWINGRVNCSEKRRGKVSYGRY